MNILLRLKNTRAVCHLKGMFCYQIGIFVLKIRIVETKY